MKILTKKILVSLLRIYALLCISLYFGQDYLLFHPTHDIELAKSISDDPQITTLKISAPDSTTLARISGTGSNMTFYFGGNAENTDYVVRFWSYDQSDYRLATLNYRGFGASEGKAREANMHEDALKLYDLAIEKFQPKVIRVVGRSLGTNIALFVAVHRKVDHLVLVTPYDRISDVAQTHYPMIPVSWLIHDRFDSIALAKQVRSPTSVLLADHDTVVPKKHSEALLLAFEKMIPKVHTLAWTDHNSIEEHEEYLKWIFGK